MTNFSPTPPAAMSAADLGAELVRVERVLTSFPQLGPEGGFKYRDDLTAELEARLATTPVAE